VKRVSGAYCWVPISSNSNCCAGFGNEITNIQIWALKEDGIGMADFTREIWSLFPISAKVPRQINQFQFACTFVKSLG